MAEQVKHEWTFDADEMNPVDVIKQAKQLLDQEDYDVLMIVSNELSEVGKGGRTFVEYALKRFPQIKE